MEKFPDQKRFSNLSFADFRKLAMDDTLTRHEKVGFPNSFREGKEKVILEDILKKLTRLEHEKQTVLDIGSGCSELAISLIQFCKAKQHQLILIDAPEMLDQLPNESFIKKVPACFPDDCRALIAEQQNKIQVILTYSVIQIVYANANVFDFIDSCLMMLDHQGQFLIGDIPNASSRKRFLSSPQGIAHHQQYYDAESIPDVVHFNIDHKQMDDAVILSVLMRSRNAGFNAYLLNQSPELPMSNRREDLLIIKP